MLTLTLAEWIATPQDYKGLVDGVPHIVHLDKVTGATVLEEVRIKRGRK